MPNETYTDVLPLSALLARYPSAKRMIDAMLSDLVSLPDDRVTLIECNEDHTEGIVQVNPVLPGQFQPYQITLTSYNFRLKLSQTGQPVQIYYYAADHQDDLFTMSWRRSGEIS
ncbi:MAG TPA: hypothetical protein VLH56_19330 [Dissulfurispiraceae bacterium]|nr:hypothetical protein [Dissulfurispiraceae bacterium]